jgi:hypothetical protein
LKLIKKACKIQWTTNSVVMFTMIIWIIRRCLVGMFVMYKITVGEYNISLFQRSNILNNQIYCSVWQRNCRLLHVYVVICRSFLSVRFFFVLVFALPVLLRFTMYFKTQYVLLLLYNHSIISPCNNLQFRCHTLQYIWLFNILLRWNKLMLYSPTVILYMTNIPTMQRPKRKKNELTKTIYKSLHRKLKSEQQEPN